MRIPQTDGDLHDSLAPDTSEALPGESDRRAQSMEGRGAAINVFLIIFNRSEVSSVLLRSPVAQVSAVILTAAMVSSTSEANAFMLNSSSGTWQSTVGGQHIQYGSVGDESQVRWGLPVNFNSLDFNSKSGLGFTGVGNISFVEGEVFQLGRLRHFNNPIWAGTAASAADIVIDLLFEGIGLKQFDFTLAVEETPNVEGTCAYFSNAPCADKISWDNAFASNSFKVGDRDYTLALRGFSNTPGGTIVNDFISQEGGTSEAYLFAQILDITPPPPSPPPGNESVPEPTTISGALLGLYLFIRRRPKAQTRSRA